MSAIRNVLAAMFVLGAALVHAGPAAADTYPSKIIHIVVSFAPGGITDILARALAQRLTEEFGQQVVVENKQGGAGFIGTEYVARSAPDGYTLLVTADATFVMNPHVYSKIPYDALNDFVPVTGLGISPQALVLHPSVPAHTLKELVSLGKAKPGALNYGTFGIGTSGHLNILLMEGMTGAKFTPVHYRGAAPAITDLLGGHIQMMIVSIGLVKSAWESDKLTVIGVGSTERLAQIPNIPTLAESGLSGYEAGSWYGLAAPKGTPRAIVDKLSAETQKIFAEPAFRDRFLAPSFIYSIASSPDQFAARIRADYTKWGKVIKNAGVKVQ